MPKVRQPTEEDTGAAKRIVLAGLVRGDDVHDIARDLAELHPKNNTFPGEVLIGLAADALDVAGVTRQHPLAHEGLRDKFLPECEFRGRDNRKLQYALLCVGAVRGGIEVDLLEEVYWWQSDNFWYYALCAFAGWTRSAADSTEVPIATICRQLAELHKIDLPADS